MKEYIEVSGVMSKADGSMCGQSDLDILVDALVAAADSAGIHCGVYFSLKNQGELEVNHEIK